MLFRLNKTAIPENDISEKRDKIHRDQEEAFGAKHIFVWVKSAKGVCPTDELQSGTLYDPQSPILPTTKMILFSPTNANSSELWQGQKRRIF